MSWNYCNLLQIWQAGFNHVSGYSLSAKIYEDKSPGSLATLMDVRQILSFQKVCGVVEREFT